MKTYRIITTLLSAAVFVSCNYLDFDETNGLNTHDNIYKYFDNTKQMLTNVYSYIPQDFGAVEEAMRDWRLGRCRIRQYRGRRAGFQQRQLVGAQNARYGLVAL